MTFSDFADDFGVRDDLRQAEYKAKGVHDFAGVLDGKRR